MRAGADAQIIAEAPIIHVVPALIARTRVRRGFVVDVAGRGQLGVDELADVRGQLVVGQRAVDGDGTGCSARSSDDRTTGAAARSAAPLPRRRARRPASVRAARTSDPD